MPAAPSDYTQLLDAIIAVGGKLVERLRDDPVRPGQDVALDYHLVTRSIRRSILLVHKLAENPESAHTEPAHTEQRAKHRAEARKRILREVEDAIQRRIAEPSATELRAELLDRLDSPELDDEIDGRPIPDIIADIVHDLGAVADFERNRFQRRSPGDVQYLCALANQPPGQPRPSEPATPRPLYQDAAILEDPEPIAAFYRFEALTRDRR